MYTQLQITYCNQAIWSPTQSQILGKTEELGDSDYFRTDQSTATA